MYDLKAELYVIYYMYVYGISTFSIKPQFNQTFYSASNANAIKIKSCAWTFWLNYGLKDGANNKDDINQWTDVYIINLTSYLSSLPPPNPLPTPQGAFTHQEEGRRQNQGAPTQRKGEVRGHQGRGGEGPRPRQEPQASQRFHREQQVGPGC